MPTGDSRTVSVRDVPVEPLRQLLAATPGVVLAVVFGSAARSQHTRAGDLDVAVLTDPQSGLPRPLAVEMARATRRVVDLVYLNTAPPLLRFEVARDGVVVFERSPGAWTDFRARAMVDWWDWAPMARRMHRAAAARVRAALAPNGKSLSE